MGALINIVHVYSIESSCVTIGLKDSLNKGLGFELDNFNDPNHEYSQVSPRCKEILINKRQQVIEFVIKLAGKYFICLLLQPFVTHKHILASQILLKG